MKKEDTLDKSLINGLQSSDINKVDTTVKKIIQIVSVDYMPFVFDSLVKTEDEKIKELLSQYLYDQKEESVKNHLITAINNKKFKSILQILVSSCWQNGINFKDYFILFTDIFINEDFIVSIEAFSVIESILEDLKQEEKDLITKKLKYSVNKMDETKKSFTISLINMIQEF